jgi:phosphate transport system substrate-binding protein
MAGEVTGAGATFPYPVYSKWSDSYAKETGNRVNYQSVGSGAGIKQIQAKTVAFGASDMPLTKEQLDKDGMFQFPTVIGGVVLAYNVEGVDDLLLDNDTVGNIYLGKVKKWNDAAIAKLNPGKTLPDTAITVVRRSDGSGTTFIFTEYLSKVSAEWQKSVGSGTAIEWPVGVGAKGNEGIAGNIAQTKNSIGYVEYAYAKQNKLKYAALQINGKIVAAEKATFQSNTWPITSPTYIIMYKKPVDEAAHKQALDFFRWAYSKGDAIADELDYVPLSKEEKDSITRSWN